MEDFIFYIISFGVVYLIYLFLIIMRKKKKEKYTNSTEFKYLIKKYKLNVDKLNIDKLIHVLALSNAFIIATTVFIIGFINNYILKILVGFVILLPLCIFIYHIIGTYLKRKEKSGKNV